MTAGPYSIGSDTWPGLSKLLEEAGELSQVLGKLIGSAGEVQHFDGTNLRDRLREELGDVEAAMRFFIEANDLDDETIGDRAALKLARFQGWHMDWSAAA